MHLYKAIIEGVNYALFEGKKAIERKTKVKMEMIGLSDGGAKSDEVCQIATNIRECLLTGDRQMKLRHLEQLSLAMWDLIDINLSMRQSKTWYKQEEFFIQI